MFSNAVLVALDTGEDVVYAPASGLGQLYLFWTFRNFRSLPQTVLNPRQQRLIASLYREARNHPSQDLTDAVVVGTVEDFNPASFTSHHTSATERQPAFLARFAWDRTALRVGTGTLVAAISVLTWYQLRAQPSRGSGSTPTVFTAYQSPESGPLAKEVAAKDLSPAPIDLVRNPVAPSPSPVSTAVADLMPAPPIQPVATAEVTLKPVVKLSTKTRHGSNDLIAKAHHTIPAQPTVLQTAADKLKMRISGRPQKLVYPVCPETRTRGKVSLEAVVNYDGVVSRVRVLTGDRVLAAAAVEAVRQWRYEPFTGAAQQLERETNITVSFISSEVVAVSFPDSAPLSR